MLSPSNFTHGWPCTMIMPLFTYNNVKHNLYNDQGSVTGTHYTHSHVGDNRCHLKTRSLHETWHSFSGHSQGTRPPPPLKDQRHEIFCCCHLKGTFSRDCSPAGCKYNPKLSCILRELTLSGTLLI